MKFYRILGVIALLCVATASSVRAQNEALDSQTKEAPETVTPQQASYALGVMIGRSVKETLTTAPGGDKLDQTLVLKALSDFLAGPTTPTVEEAGKLLQTYFMAAQSEAHKECKAEGEKFLAENAKKKGVKVTKSGLQYKILTEGNGVRPTVEDTVLVHYRGRLIDGTEFDSSYNRGEPVKFSPLQVIAGWTEGLCLLPKGTKAELYIPADLAYGDRGAGDIIPPFATLIFEIEMLDVIKGEAIPVVEASGKENKTIQVKPLKEKGETLKQK
ncbi:MAG: FKBP-type peptidyl-prolyl cis-trans isomerase [Bacteroidales bacterium]|nr:FKBP-type peptidyl-prolyl cis-trans isomerase [Porphyromonas sp.]MDD6935207.1 FKBP-type peptidyl-prolyl cis-trans isomerase [Bacteroidales bacterium]MDY3102436.1 FKBP-type peptidyl-prolyl cis-trans isomerase [Porphyromonas sp.]